MASHRHRSSELFASCLTGWHSLAAVVLGLIPATLLASDVEYTKDVRPILARHCFRCHSSAEIQGELRVDSAQHLLQGGASGPAIEPGKSGASNLLLRVLSADEAERMPAEGDRLSEQEIAVLKAWIDAGAPSKENDRQSHWAFIPPLRPAAPSLDEATGPAGERATNPVDAFLAAIHKRHSLVPAPPVDRAALLRRVTFDLTGLPPTVEELQAFLADSSPTAYERVVDRLLASPLYGQRWGRHWMDVWRYSDWAGYAQEVRDSQPHIWRWRDWIVSSLNDDKGYDQMVVEMLAGDELAPDDESVVAATGYLVRSWYKFNRNVWLDKTIEHTGKAFLGVTLGCARCHDHMYDPMKQEEYYSFRAFFEPHNVRTDVLPHQPDPAKDGLVRVFDEKLDATTVFFERGDERKPVPERTFTPATPEMLGPSPAIASINLPPSAWYPALQPHVKARLIQESETRVGAARNTVAAAEQRLASALADRERLASGVAADTPSSTLVSDDFSAPQAEVWETGDGAWKHENGRLVQLQTGASMCTVVSRQSLPSEFAARLLVKITGGQMWKSVGLSFDRRDDKNYRSVYISAYAGGPKLQVSQTVQGETTYPPEGAKAVPLETGRDYALEVFVRGDLVNVYLDGQFALAYRFSSACVESPFAFWSFDASAEFDEVSARRLDRSMALADVGGEKVALPPLTLEAAEVLVAAAERERELAGDQLAAAESAHVSLNARLAAEEARYLGSSEQPLAELTQAAAQADRTAKLAEAHHALRVAEKTLAEAQAAKEKNASDEQATKALAEAETRIAAARQEVEKAQARAADGGSDYSPVGTQYPPTSSGRRLALARWIVSPANPLAARVAVNHIWQRHFQEPLAPTMFDLGANSQPPSAPELLDFLAVSLQESGWRMKPLHRLIVTSQAYQRDSQPSQAIVEANAAIDPDNRLLWRMNSRRMEAEVVRDSLLAMAGDLDLAFGGPELDEATGLTTRRRSMYYRHAREKQMTLLKIFDAANPEECYRRPTSIAPQQALALANSPLALSQTRTLARRISLQVGQGPEHDDRYIDVLFETTLARTPSGEERAACRKFLREQSERLADAARLTAFSTGGDPQVKPSPQADERARESLARVLCNHHEFVTIR